MLFQLLAGQSVQHCVVSICVYLIFPKELKARTMPYLFFYPYRVEYIVDAKLNIDLKQNKMKQKNLANISV